MIQTENSTAHHIPRSTRPEHGANHFPNCRGPSPWGKTKIGLQPRRRLTRLILFLREGHILAGTAWITSPLRRDFLHALVQTTSFSSLCLLATAWR